MNIPRPTAAELRDPRSHLVLVNKLRPLDPPLWVPEDLELPQGLQNTSGHPLRAAVARALEALAAAAAVDQMPLLMVSGYRSFELQRSLFERYVETDGVSVAEMYSARPSHSEHQTGLAVDLDDGSGLAFTSEFGETATGRWLRERAPEFGFIFRYEQGEQSVVGYIYEPWHFRYVGTPVALDMRALGIVNYEEYVGAEPAPTYAG